MESVSRLYLSIYSLGSRSPGETGCVCANIRVSNLGKRLHPSCNCRYMLYSCILSWKILDGDTRCWVREIERAQSNQQD